MTAFSTLYWRRCRARLGILLMLAVCLAGSGGAFAADNAAPEVSQLRVERDEDGWSLSALVRLELTPTVEDALLKGVAMFFVAEVEIFRDRWYWYDPKVISTSKTYRLAYQPLTRRWRLNSATGSDILSGAALNQYFESLPEAMATLRRITRWKIAEAQDLPSSAGHYLNFRFRLDISQLPRPFQIGAVGQPDWNLAASITQRLRIESP